MSHAQRLLEARAVVALSRLIRQSSRVDDTTKVREVREFAEDCRDFAQDLNFGAVRTQEQFQQITRMMRRDNRANNDAPKNLIIFIRD